MFAIKLLRFFAFAALVLCASIGFSQQAGQQVLHVTPLPEAASGPPSAYVEPYGVALSPAMYLVNFLLIYFSSPEVAANMPAYRAALPEEVYQCLVDNPEGCSYPDMAKYFAKQALETGSRNKNTFWPSTCQTDPRWQTLAPPQYRQAGQINQPLGRKKADQLARLLGIEQDMILTEDQYKCQMGTFPRDPAREIIYACTKTVTNSIGNADAGIPLSSYGLYLNTEGEVRSTCAPRAPCLEFNKLVLGPVEKIALECGYWDKFVRLNQETPIIKLAQDGAACQGDWLPPCIVETACPGNGVQSNNNCAASSATQ